MSLSRQAEKGKSGQKQESQASRGGLGTPTFFYHFYLVAYQLARTLLPTQRTHHSYTIKSKRLRRFSRKGATLSKALGNVRYLSTRSTEFTRQHSATETHCKKLQAHICQRIADHISCDKSLPTLQSYVTLSALASYVVLLDITVLHLHVSGITQL